MLKSASNKCQTIKCEIMSIANFFPCKFSFLPDNQKWKNSNEEKVHLENIDFDAAGRYYCEVSTDTPIFTKESNVEEVYVISKIK